MTLAEFLARHSLTPTQFGRQIQARSRATVHRYLAGTRRPSPRMQRRIVEATDGAVTPADWPLPAAEPPHLSEAA